MDGVIRTSQGWPGEGLHPCLQGGSTPLLDLVCSVSQLGKEMPQLFLHRGFCAQAQVRGDLFACPVPDRLVGIEIRTIARQIHQSQAQVWSSQVGTHGITAMGWGIVPEHDQSSGVLFPQLLQESGRGLGVTVTPKLKPKWDLHGWRDKN